MENLGGCLGSGIKAIVVAGEVAGGLLAILALMALVIHVLYLLGVIPFQLTLS